MIPRAQQNTKNANAVKPQFPGNLASIFLINQNCVGMNFQGKRQGCPLAVIERSVGTKFFRK